MLTEAEIPVRKSARKLPNLSAPKKEAAPPSRQHIVSLDVLRAVAALLVLLSHWASLRLPGNIPAFEEVGRLGVDIFFILSGYLIYQTISRPKEFQLKRYLNSRSRRILPAYWFSLLIIVAVVKARWISDGSSWTNVVAHIPLIHAFFKESVLAINSPYWTLSHEWFFYGLMALAAAPIRTGKPWRIVATLVLVGFAYRLALTNDWVNFGSKLFHPLGMLTHFGCGVACAILVERTKVLEKLKRPRVALAALLVVLALGTVAVLRFHEHGEVWDRKRSMVLWFPFIASIPISTLLLLMVSWDPAIGKWLKRTPLPWIGTISYSLYLWHMPVMQNWENALEKAPADSFMHHPLPGSALMLTMIFLVSSASYYFIEAAFLSPSTLRKHRIHGQSDGK
ncbi:acyltransferase family protein [Sulfuriroseicoccus oceanibius]|uniref:Acyltransferase n=1 Tax=Sulfuriroseicoccus oceanibius TaxID=2707525 RepID=A0A6B3L1S9_9BACT|nr:acyltransferase [Sulfuriroseicoccus oceanibius]QQL46318.1 acyltransferase [Sulfuriroseicoccus oceanibius]